MERYGFIPFTGGGAAVTDAVTAQTATFHVDHISDDINRTLSDATLNDCNCRGAILTASGQGRPPPSLQERNERSAIFLQTQIAA